MAFIRQHRDMKRSRYEKCHDGKGWLDCFSVLTSDDSEHGITFMHDDILEPGASIGEHPHNGCEEIYFVISGHGLILLDGKPTPIGPGDVSLVKSGHSHGIANSDEGPMRLIVVGVKTRKREM
jgi:mannose-6-phosphate isomerase-like protein (cupin superfamily)